MLLRQCGLRLYRKMCQQVHDFDGVGVEGFGIRRSWRDIAAIT